MKNLKYTFLLSLLLNTLVYAQTVFWAEDFGTGTCANRGQLATSYAGVNGSWTQIILSSDGSNSNQFYVSATEAFTGKGNASDGCIGNATLTNQTLHVDYPPIGTFHCSSGDCGATYNKSNHLADTHKRIESPVIDCTGKENITVTFDYMMFGRNGLHEARLFWNNGLNASGWSPLVIPLPQVPCSGLPCGSVGAKGKWSPTGYTINLPAAANNNPNVRIAFVWINKEDVSGLAGGQDPSFAVDNIQIAGTSIIAPVITEGTSVDVMMSEDGNPTPFSLTLNATDPQNDVLTWSILTQAIHGTASASGTGNSKSIGYTPNANYAGTDSFVVQVSDGTNTDSITVNVTIEPVLDIPTTQTLTGAATITCPQDNTLTLQNSETNFNYFLRNDATKTVIGNAQTGIGSALNFQTGEVAETTDFYVFAANPSYALNFDGTDDYVSIPHSSPLDFTATDRITIETWINPTDLSANGGFQEIFRKDNGGGGRILLSFQENNMLAFGLDTASGGYQELDVTINHTDYENQWVHILATYDGNTMKLYREGIEIGSLVKSGVITPAAANTQAYIGSVNGTAEFFQGKIASLRVWDKALTTTQEIQQAKDNLFVGDETNLATYYPFFENAGTQLTDSSANTNNGTISGATWSAGTTGGVGKIASNTQTITFNNPAIVYVDENASGNNTGCDWSNAFTDIQSAIDTVATNGQVLIAAGTYKQGAEIIIDKPIKITGGYPAGGDTQDIANNLTILDGDSAHRVIRTTHSSGIVQIEGITIQNGRISGPSTEEGAGIYSTGDMGLNSVIIKDNNANTFFDGNNGFASTFTRSSGGGIYINSGNVTLTNSIVSNNLTSSFNSNEFSSAGAVSNGGGIYTNSGNITLINSLVSGNTTTSSASSTRDLSESFSNGGGVYTISGNITLINSMVTNNQTSASATNLVSSLGGGVFGATILQNSILWNNSTNSAPSEHEGITLTTDYSLIKGVDLTTENGLDATVGGFDPLFVDEANGDYRLQVGSPLINAGLDSYNTTTADLDQKLRIVSQIDIGPYEYQSSPIGLSKNVTVNGTQVTFDYYLENYGMTDASQLNLKHNLDNAFGAGNYTITQMPQLATTTKSGAFTQINFDSNYTGSNIGSDNTNMLLPSSLLADLDSIQIRMIVVVDNVVDLGSGQGQFTSQAELSGLNLLGDLAADFSTDGNNPDPNDNNDPAESTANAFFVDASTPVELLQFEVE